jgi:hypothetical protein
MASYPKQHTAFGPADNGKAMMHSSQVTILIDTHKCQHMMTHDIHLATTRCVVTGDLE